MSSHAESGHAAHDASHTPAHYIKIWAVLLVLLVVSVTGPMLGIRTVTLATAFGIACVKAFLVVKHFMHLTVERKVAQYAIAGCAALMLLFFFAVAPDVMSHVGTNWENVGAANMKHQIEASEHHHAGAEGAAASEHAGGAAAGEHAGAEAAPAAEPTH